jgi:hypothetical protein
MKRTIIGAIIAIMSVGIGPAMLAGPAAVLADEADDEEVEEESHDPENSGGGGGGGTGSPPAPIEIPLFFPPLEPGQMDLPALNLVGPRAPSGEAIRQQVEQEVEHVHRQNCCPIDLTPEELQEAIRRHMELQEERIGIPSPQTTLTDIHNDIKPQIEIVEDLGKTIDIDVEQRLR